MSLLPVYLASNTQFYGSKVEISSGISVGYAGTAVPTGGLLVSGNVGIGTISPCNILAIGPYGAAFPAPSGNAPLYACRAWVNFDGTTAGSDPATMTIRGSGNVSSITRNSTGDYTINFTTALPNANYAVSLGFAQNASAGAIQYTVLASTSQSTAALKSTTQLRLTSGTVGSNRYNFAELYVTIHC